jgi:hypothetical protein
MKIRSALYAGVTFEQCDQVRNYWKQMAQSGQCIPNPYPPTPTPPAPPPTPSPYPPSAGGGWVNGVWYPDMSGYC